MQSLSSMSFEADPLPMLPHTWVTLLISLPLCLILLPHASLFSHFPFHKPFFLSLPFIPLPLYLLSLQPLLCYAVTRKWERHSITVFMESLMADRECVLLATVNRQCAKQQILCCVSQEDRHGLIPVSLITQPRMEIVAYATIRAILRLGLYTQW